MIDIDKKYQTRDGRPVRLISDNGTPEYPIIGIVDGGGIRPRSWTAEGKYSDLCPDFDLVPVPLPKVRVAVWIDKEGAPRCARVSRICCNLDGAVIVEVPR
jgi:hypothetical protein